MNDLWWKFCWYFRAGWSGLTHPFATEEQKHALARAEATKWMDRFYPLDEGWQGLKEILDSADKGEQP